MPPRLSSRRLSSRTILRQSSLAVAGPDLAANALPRVKAPTLLIVGGADYGVIELNEEALALLACEKRLAIVPGATHLFDEPGTLERVIELAEQWFETYLARSNS